MSPPSTVMRRTMVSAFGIATTASRSSSPGLATLPVSRFMAATRSSSSVSGRQIPWGTLRSSLPSFGMCNHRPSSASSALFSSLQATTAVQESVGASTSSKVTPEQSLGYQHPAYEVLSSDFVAEYGAYCTLYRHRKSGAELLSVASDDNNKVFGITFRTPPSDSTGVPHILEHSVLCGSRKYPTKDPFVQLLQGSLQTFLNAFTYPDRTCYGMCPAGAQCSMFLLLFCIPDSLS
jgi:hypothetical protein